MAGSAVAEGWPGGVAGGKRLTVTSEVLHLPRSENIPHKQRTEGLSHEVGTRH